MKIVSREFNLVFTTAAWMQIEDAFGGIEAISERLEAGNCIASTIVKLIVILGNQGLMLAGKKGDLSEDWIAMNLRPADVASAASECVAAINRGMGMETSNGDDEAVDVVLEEIEKKKDAEA